MVRHSLQLPSDLSHLEFVESLSDPLEVISKETRGESMYRNSFLADKVIDCPRRHVQFLCQVLLAKHDVRSGYLILRAARLTSITRVPMHNGTGIAHSWFRLD